MTIISLFANYYKKKFLFYYIRVKLYILYLLQMVTFSFSASSICTSKSNRM